MEKKMSCAFFLAFFSGKIHASENRRNRKENKIWIFSLFIPSHLQDGPNSFSSILHER